MLSSFDDSDKRHVVVFLLDLTVGVDIEAKFKAEYVTLWRPAVGWNTKTYLMLIGEKITNHGWTSAEVAQVVIGSGALVVAILHLALQYYKRKTYPGDEENVQRFTSYGHNITDGFNTLYEWLWVVGKKVVSVTVAGVDAVKRSIGC
ncbi:hypothetical protein BDD12DRAFT_877074 [Trichophaea hybrida]|nr:hypothetical protein BDD12DRAFT_877074 [Trichophaea hybrida]